MNAIDRAIRIVRYEFMSDEIADAAEAEFATLTARAEQAERERDEALESIEKLFIIIGNHTGDEIKCDQITEKIWIAEAAALKARAK